MGTTLLSIFLVVVITGTIVATAMTVYVLEFMDETSDVTITELASSANTIVYANKGDKELVQLYTVKNDVQRVPVDIEDIPQHVRDAFVCVEDERFYSHEGVDYKRTFAAFANMFIHIYDTNQGGSTITQQTGGMTQADLQQVKRCYAGSVRVIDRWIGKLLDWLETSGHKDDTIVIFCADHGELLGDHGLLEKSCMYEGCLRIPLLVHLPGMTQRRDSDALAELMDLAPTCLELAGADWNRREMDAVSLVPVLNGSTEPLRPVQRSELHNCTMLFDGRYKWIRSYNDTDELYDLETDPQELHNVINEHPEVLNRMRPYSFRH